MAIDLMALEPQKISKDLKGKYILLNKKKKVGKTTIASKFPIAFSTYAIHKLYCGKFTKSLTSFHFFKPKL